ncbi:MAG: hypothetical protein IPN95_26000 [Bacteroidetes bacterium]|nr:hypothetical protein [Bacteroidota bacterium]
MPILEPEQMEMEAIDKVSASAFLVKTRDLMRVIEKVFKKQNIACMMSSFLGWRTLVMSILQE